MTDGCEWNPVVDALAYETDAHFLEAPAEVLVGADGQYRLCAACADLPRFRRFKKRKWPGSPVTQERSRAARACQEAARRASSEAERFGAEVAERLVREGWDGEEERRRPRPRSFVARSWPAPSGGTQRIAPRP